LLIFVLNYGVNMETSHVWAIVGVNIGLIAAMLTVVVWVATKHDADIKSIVTRIDGHAARIDQLYQMFCDLMKEKK